MRGLGGEPEESGPWVGVGMGGMPGLDGFSSSGIMGPGMPPPPGNSGPVEVWRR